MLFQTEEAYYNLDVTKVKCNKNELSKLEREKGKVHMSPNTERLKIRIVDTM